VISKIVGFINLEVNKKLPFQNLFIFFLNNFKERERFKKLTAFRRIQRTKKRNRYLKDHGRKYSKRYS
jgi:hypothetical protein